jgi:hypothetical protein
MPIRAQGGEVADFIAMSGGLDLVSPPIATPKGRLRAAFNYEPGPDGYARLGGFERLDGHPKPSEATYAIMNFVAGTVAPVVDATITGATSTATARVLTEAYLASGSYGGGDAAGFVVVTAVSGTFIDGEPLGFATLDGDLVNSADTDEEDTLWSELAVDTARPLISKPTGSGGIRGVKTYLGDQYCWRDSIDGLTCRMHKATPTGWSEVMLGATIAFTSGGVHWTLPYTSGGTYEIVAGDTITGATSAKTAIVESLTLTSGTWAGADAAGTLTLVSVSGAFQAENLNVGANANVATVGGPATLVNSGAELVDGDPLTGATSAATATIGRVVLQGGAWASGNASGYLTLLPGYGAFVAELLNSGAITDIATIAGPATAVTLPPGGRYEFVIENFYAASNMKRLYGVNGVGPAFEWDGETFVPIDTGISFSSPSRAARCRTAASASR